MINLWTYRVVRNFDNGSKGNWFFATYKEAEEFLKKLMADGVDPETLLIVDMSYKNKL